MIQTSRTYMFEAVQQQASDIHFQPVENAMVVRMRMEGVLRKHPNEEWMMEVANKVTNAETGFLRGKKILLLDLDTKFTLKFREHLKAPGTEPIRLPPKSPNCNAFIERFFRSIKTECVRSEIPNQLWKSKLTLRAPSLESAYSRNHFLSQKCCVPFLLFHDSAFAFSGLIDKVREDFS